MTSRAQMPLVRGRSNSENLTFSALLCEQMYNEKRASDDETKNIAGRIPETTRIVVQNNLYRNLDKIRISKKTLEITKIVDQCNIKSVKIFSVQRCVCMCCWGGGGFGRWGQVGGGGGCR